MALQRRQGQDARQNRVVRQSRDARQNQAVRRDLPVRPA